MGNSTNLTNRVGSRLIEGAIELFSLGDLPTPSGGVITLTSDLYYVRGNVELGTNRLEFTGPVQFISDQDNNARIGYDGTGTMFTSTDGGVRIRGVQIELTGNGAQLFDISGSSQTSVEETNLSFTGTSGSLGSVVNGGLFSLRFSQLGGFTTGLTLDGRSVLNLRESQWTPSTSLSGPCINATGSGALLISIDTHALVFLNLLDFIFIDPLVTTDQIIISGIVDLTGAATLFESRALGSLTAIADAAITTTGISSVTDSGGIARFNYSVGPTTFVGQTVTISGYVTNTAYNTTGVITATGIGFLEISSIAFGSDEGVGSFVSDSVTVTSTAHGLSNETHISILDTINYNAGYIIYNVQTNTFEVSAVFVTTEAGTWDSGSLNESSPNVIAFNNPSEAASSVKAEAFVFGNVTETSIPAAGALVHINSSAWSSDAEERIKVTSEGDSIYQGVEEVGLKLDGNVLLEPANATKELSCRFVRQDAARRTVTFTNGTNVVNETSTPRVDNDTITFHDNAGTLPTGLRDDITYYVVSAATNTFQVSYTEGGSAITFTTDGSGTNTYAIADLHGSRPTEPIASANPRTLVPQALIDSNTLDKVHLTITNNDDAVNVTVTDAYYRIVI